MTALIITGGDCPGKDVLQELYERCGFCVAADSGAHAALDAGIKPDYLVGDFDSIQDVSLLKNFPEDAVHSYPVEKDDTDTELSIKLAREKGADKVLIAGAGGGRLDHMLAVFSLFLKPHAPQEWHTSNETALLVEGEFFHKLPVGKRVSVFPLSCETSILHSTGLKWPLDGFTWQLGDHGISNIAVHDTVSINLGSGKLLLIFDSTKKDRP